MPLPLVDPVFLQLQGLVAGRFSLEREIGRGGMGIVYLARDVALERPVAIKVLAPSLAARPDMRARFLREARIAAQCFHPHIVPIHAVEEADGLAWIVMAYVRGETLAERLRRAGPLDRDNLRRLAREVGWALDYSHQRGVVHRDIKPENLLIDASTGRYLLSDFGIAQRGDERITPPDGAAPGTARYMAPEQALGESLDGRADLYALGVTLFVAGTGRAPFEGASAVALVAQHAAQPAPSIRLYAPGLPLSLSRAIDRCLAKRPDDRFADAAHFLAAIEPDVREQPMAIELHAARDHAAAARTMLTWTTVTLVSTMLLLAGEQPGSFGRAIISAFGLGATGVFAFGSALRGIEALLEARRLLRQGQSTRDVASALTGVAAATAPEPSRTTRRIAGAALAVAGAAIALAQAKLSLLSASTAFPGLPAGATDFMDSALQVGALLVPPVLIARGVGLIASTTRVREWMRARISAPLSALATRMLSRRTLAHRQVVLDDAPTELLLLRAVESAVRVLPEAHRAALADAATIARRLAGEVARLREQLHALDGDEAAALAMSDTSTHASALALLQANRQAVTRRLQASVTALESLRLDVLRAVADDTEGGLTTAIDRAREVQQRVDAIQEVRRLLQTPT